MEYNLLDIVWTMIAACLVYFMQAGFAMVETGFTRAKNAGNIVMKNMMDFVIGSIAFFLIGFGLMFGQGNGIIGLSGFFDPYSLEASLQSGLGLALPIGVFMIFHTVFCATSATIVSGAMAERTKFSAYLAYSACISIFIYPITGHWIWGGGWLSSIGFHDFAGSTAVHSVGGWCALIGAAILGPRIGKYRADGKPNAIPGHNLPLGALGTFILWFCWFGFNCGSTTAASPELGNIAMTTNLAAAASTLVALFFTWVRYGKPDISMTMNGALAGLVGVTAGCDIVSNYGALAGLVGVTAGCDIVSNYGALAIGVICGFAVVLVVEFVDRVLKIDDPVGATGVHWGCGMLGTILTGVFAKSSVLEEYGMSRIQFIGVETLGVAAVGAFTIVMAIIIFKVIDKTIGLRVSEQEELDGLDGHEHGSSAYADFQIKL